MNSLIPVIRRMAKRAFKLVSAYRVPTTIHSNIEQVMATKKWEHKKNKWPMKNRTKLQSHSSRIVYWLLRIKMVVIHSNNSSSQNHLWWPLVLLEATLVSSVNIKMREGWASQIIPPTQFTERVWHRVPTDNSVSNPEMSCQTLIRVIQ